LFGPYNGGLSLKSQLFLQTEVVGEFGFKNKVWQRRDSLESLKTGIPKKLQNIISYTKINSKVNTSKNLFGFAHNWNDGKMGTK
jgi:hypothetical protein